MSAGSNAGDTESSGLISLLVELRGQTGVELSADEARRTARRLPGCKLDEGYEPVPMGDGATYIVRCLVADRRDVDELRRQPEVAAVWTDTPIAPMDVT